MSEIPFNARKFGAEALTNYPIGYDKSRLSGSITLSYILHINAGCMPGQKQIFIPNYLTKPNLNESIKTNRSISSYREKRLQKSFIPKGPQYLKDNLYAFTFDKYYPNDDETLDIAIKNSYRQALGNLHPMESERPIDAERRLRNGDITIREFIRIICKSNFYKKHYFENVNQARSIELNYKHILGRVPISKEEIIMNVEALDSRGFDEHIDTLIDSEEYFLAYGNNIVPYPRCWNSALGMKTSTFNNYAEIEQGFATSDNVKHKKSNVKNYFEG